MVSPITVRESYVRKAGGVNQGSGLEIFFLQERLRHAILSVIADYDSHFVVTATIAASPLPSSARLRSSQRKMAEGIDIPMGKPTKHRNQTLTGICLSSE